MIGQYVDWEYYNSHFPNLEEEEFNKHLYKAERIVIKRVKNVEIDEETETNIKDCICEVINCLSSHSSSGISSVSNDGYSETYTKKTSDEQKAEIESILDQWLGTAKKSKWVAF